MHWLHAKRPEAPTKITCYSVKDQASRLPRFASGPSAGRRIIEDFHPLSTPRLDQPVKPTPPSQSLSAVAAARGRIIGPFDGLSTSFSKHFSISRANRSNHPQRCLGVATRADLKQVGGARCEGRSPVLDPLLIDLDRFLIDHSIAFAIAGDQTSLLEQRC